MRYLLLCILYFIALVSSFVYRYELNAPPNPGDGPDYDMLAYSLSTYGDYYYRWHDNGYLTPYMQANDNGSYSYLLERSNYPISTIYRAPFYPIFLASIYKIFGRSFSAVRVFQFLGIALVLARVFYSQSIASLLISIFIILFDDWFVRYSGAFLSECLALILFTILYLYIDSLRSKKSNISFLFIGAMLSFLILTRFFFAPLIIIISYRIYRQYISIPNLLCYLITLILPILIWTSYAFKVSHTLMPLGSLGGINIVEGFSDTAVTSWGMWTGREVRRLEEVRRKHNGDNSLHGASEEAKQALANTKVTINWILNNKTDSIILIARKWILVLLTTPLLQLLVILLVITNIFNNRNFRLECGVIDGISVVLISTSIAYAEYDGRYFFPIFAYLLSVACILSADFVSKALNHRLLFRHRNINE